MSRPPRWVDTLAEEVIDALKVVRMDCEFLWEPVPGTRLIRIYVISKGFKNLGFSERQSVLWRIAQGVLTESQLAKISMILTLTPDEYGDG